MKRLSIIFLSVLSGYLFLAIGFPAFYAWTRAIGINDEIIFYGKYVVIASALVGLTLLCYGASILYDDDEGTS